MTLKNQRTDSRDVTDAGDNNSGSERNPQLPDHDNCSQNLDFHIVIEGPPENHPNICTRAH